MAWFHKKLKDLIVAFEQQDWDTAADILRDHDIEIKQEQGEKAKLELEEAAFNLAAYTQLLNGIRRIINQEHWMEPRPKNWPFDEHDRTRVLGELKKAELRVQEFERIVKRLIAEGKFME